MTGLCARLPERLPVLVGASRPAVLGFLLLATPQKCLLMIVLRGYGLPG